MWKMENFTSKIWDVYKVEHTHSQHYSAKYKANRNVYAKRHIKVCL